jgi:hypothetical protein
LEVLISIESLPQPGLSDLDAVTCLLLTPNALFSILRIKHSGLIIQKKGSSFNLQEQVMQKLSVYILTYNEEAKIGAAIKSVSFADEP